MAVKSDNATTVIFVVMYRTGSLNNNFFQDLVSLLSFISTQSDNIIIHFEKVNDNTAKYCTDLFMSYGFKQNISEPTHVDGGTIVIVIVIEIIFYKPVQFQSYQYLYII